MGSFRIAGSGEPDDIEFLVSLKKPFRHPKYDKFELAESVLSVYNKSWGNYCKSHAFWPKVTRHLLAL